MTYGFKNLNETDIVESASTLLGLNEEGAVVQVSAENVGGGGSSSSFYTLSITEENLNYYTYNSNSRGYNLVNVDEEIINELHAAIDANMPIQIRYTNSYDRVIVCSVAYTTNGQLCFMDAIGEGSFGNWIILNFQPKI